MFWLRKQKRKVRLLQAKGSGEANRFRRYDGEQSVRTSIFKKANKLKKQVTKQGDSRQYAFFTFKELEDPPVVCLEVDGITKLKSCTCTHHSINQIHNPLCAYQVAVVLYLCEQSVASPLPKVK